MNLLVGTLSMGLLLSLLALGVYITYRVLGTVDLTTDGSFGAGAAVAAALIASGMNPLAATVAAAAAGVGAGLATGMMYAAFGVNLLIAGILTSTALYSANLVIMGGGNIAITNRPTLLSLAERAWTGAGAEPLMTIGGSQVSMAHVATLVFLLLLAAAIVALLDYFFRTRIGLAMRATGDNAQMAAAQGIGVSRTTVLGLLLANALIALAGALFAQYQGFANIEMGVGMIVTGLACVILGETFFGVRGVRRALLGAVAGAVALRLLVAAALRLGLDPNALKLLTAVLVLMALLLPRAFAARQRRGASASV